MRMIDKQLYYTVYTEKLKELLGLKIESKFLAIPMRIGEANKFYQGNDGDFILTGFADCEISENKFIEKLKERGYIGVEMRKEK